MTRLKNFLKKLIYEEQSSHRLAVSFCLGIYIAFSPFVGLHTVMIFVFSWIFKLNFAVMFASAYFVNNIWTAVPIYALDYIFGYWLVHDFGQITNLINPWWMSTVEWFIENKLGFTKPCLWSFLIGGNVLGIVLALLCYPPIKRTFSKLISVHITTKPEPTGI